MPNKTVISNFNAIEENDTLTYDTLSISKIFKNFFSNLAKSVLIMFVNPPDKYNSQSVIRYYSSFIILDDFCLSNTSEEKVLKIMTNIESSKAAGVDKLSSRFFKRWHQHINKTHFYTLQSLNLTGSLPKCL